MRGARRKDSDFRLFDSSRRSQFGGSGSNLEFRRFAKSLGRNPKFKGYPKSKGSYLEFRQFIIFAHVCLLALARSSKRRLPWPLTTSATVDMLMASPFRCARLWPCSNRNRRDWHMSRFCLRRLCPPPRGVLPQSARAPGQNKEHRARDFCGLGRIARPPKHRGMNEHQIAFDQRLQAIRITMAHPGFETFSIRSSWNCAAGSLRVLVSVEALYAGHFSCVSRGSASSGGGPCFQAGAPAWPNGWPAV